MDVCFGHVMPVLCILLYKEADGGILDVAFLPCQAIFTAFLAYCGLGTSTCLITVVGSKEDHAPSIILSLQQILFVSVIFCEDYDIVTDFEVNLATLSFGDITGFKTLICKIFL